MLGITAYCELCKDESLKERAPFILRNPAIFYMNNNLKDKMTALTVELLKTPVNKEEVRLSLTELMQNLEEDVEIPADILEPLNNDLRKTVMAAFVFVMSQLTDK